MKVKLEDGSEIELRKKFSNGVYTQTGNGSGIKSEQRELMSKAEAQKVAERFRLKGNLARVVKHSNKYLVYYKFGK